MDQIKMQFKRLISQVKTLDLPAVFLSTYQFTVNVDIYEQRKLGWYMSGKHLLTLNWSSKTIDQELYTYLLAKSLFSCANSSRSFLINSVRND